MWKRSLWFCQGSRAMGQVWRPSAGCRFKVESYRLGRETKVKNQRSKVERTRTSNTQHSTFNIEGKKGGTAFGRLQVPG